MEYEKKYNDLIARINEAKEKPSLCMKDKHHYNGYVETGIRDALDYIVNPESEDERIRKKLYHTVLGTSDTDEWFEDISKDKVLAYLEKQKEAQPGDEDRYMEGYMNGMNDALKEQKPAEWSEEDGKMIQSLILEIDKYVFFAGIESKKIINFLKALRPQPHWKPNEEQMEALKDAVAYYHHSWISKEQDSLESLYNDLKKL